MAGAFQGGGADLFRGISVPIAAAVAIVVALAWVVTWATSDLAMGLLGMGGAKGMGFLEVAVFFATMVVMMVAMMLPSALPMILAYHGIIRLEAGRPTRPPDPLSTGLFTSSYFVVWGAFGVLALLALMALGRWGPMTGAWVLVPAGALLAAGVYQVTRAKEACLSQCQSPMGFVMLHWRAGRLGAVRMGLRHATYCLGCCWLFMIALFVAGSMSLVWMGALSVAIFAEKVTTRQVVVTRAIGVILVILGVLVASQALPMI